MTVDELEPILRYVEAACGTRVPFTEQQTAVWFDLLGDLPAAAVKAAVRTVCIDHGFPTIPPVGLVRKAAVAIQAPPAIPGPEAWNLFLAAVRRFGSGRRSRMVKGEMREWDASEQGLQSLSPVVAHAAKCFGWQRLCDTSGEHMGIAERDFLQSYGTLEKRDEQLAIMPPSVRAIANNAGDNFALPDTSTTRGPRELAAHILQKAQQPKGV